MTASDASKKQVAGRYEPSEAILHLWFPKPVGLHDERAVAALFDEVVEDWIAPRTSTFFLLVAYDNLHIAPNMADAYAAQLARFQNRLRGTFRYGLPQDFTGVAVTLGNLKLAAPSRIYPDERAAREAIREIARKGRSAR